MSNVNDNHLVMCVKQAINIVIVVIGKGKKY